MAAPAAALYTSYTFRDYKGQIAVMKVIIGGASLSAVTTTQASFKSLLAAVTNAAVRLPSQENRTIAYGSSGTYQDVEDKAVLTYADPLGYLHRFQIAAPKSAGFLADGETVDITETNMAALNAVMVASMYGRTSDTAPLVYIGGVRVRRRTQRKYNIITKNPAVTGPGL